MLSNRQVRILELLIDQEDYLTISSIAKKFGITQRTIQYDFEFIESIQNKFNFKLIRNKALGVKIQTEDKRLFQELKNYTSQYIHLSKDERVLVLTLELFDSNTPVSSRVLSECVGVSRRTIMSDLKEIEDWLNHYLLQLNYQKNKGFVIIGNEEHYRKAYANRIQEYFKKFTSLAGIKSFSSEELTLVRNTVIYTLKQENYHLVQTAIDALIYHILIAIRRLQENYSFKVPLNQQNKISKTYQYSIALKIIERLEYKFKFKFPLTETIFITLHLLGSKTIDNNEFENENKQLNMLLIEFIYKVGAELGINLSDDKRLFDGLLVHLTPAIHRLKFNMVQKNPLKKEVHKRYKHIDEIVKRNIINIEKNFDIHFNDDEIAFLDIHIASSVEKLSSESNQRIKVVLLCGSGIGTSQLLKNKLTNLYPEFEIVDAYSIYQINEKELKENGIDYIISTVPVNVENLSVIQVDPFLNKSSRIKLNNVINFSREKRFNQNYKNSYELKDLLPAHRINKVTKIMNKDEAIDISIQSLIEDGIVSPKYSCEIKKQLDIFGPYMVISPHIALIHASNKYVIEGAGFAITFFKNGIIFNHELNDPVYLVITIATINPYYHLNGLIQLSELLTDSENRNIFLKGNINRIKNLVANSIKKEV